MEFDYRDYTVPFYFAPVSSILGITIIVTDHTTLGIYNVDTIGLQARLIGLFFLFYSGILLFYVFYKIPKSIGEGKIKKILVRFVKSPFLYIWILTIFLDLYTEYTGAGKIITFVMLIICYIFQRKFNKAMIDIYKSKNQ